jgi:lysophospholipase L1-like esterase
MVNSDRNSTPATVTGLSSGVAAVSAGLDHTCALTVIGGVLCWGANDQGQVGEGTISPGTYAPANVVGLSTGVSTISAGAFHTCAVTTAGSAQCWGGNDENQLGLGATNRASSDTPMTVLGLSSGIAAIGSGFEQTCALSTVGSAKCWGYGQDGQLGDDRVNETSDQPRDVVGGEVWRLPTASGSPPTPPGGGDSPPVAPGTGNYVALGDSYSSGEGNPPYLSGTDVPNGDKCHRSALSYSFDVNNDLGFYAPRFSFHACSGARIGDFYNANAGNHEKRQLDWLGGVGGDTQLATLTIGGNDAHFADVIGTCFASALAVAAQDTTGGLFEGLIGSILGDAVVNVASCKTLWNGQVNSAISLMGNNSPSNKQSLAQLYEAIANATPPTAQILAVGYPRFFPGSPPATCATGAGGSFDRDTMTWIDQKIQKLDQVIHDAAAAANNSLKAQRVHYVDTYNAFSGHERCTSHPYLNGIIKGRSNAAVGSFHPNTAGHRALAIAVEQTHDDL